MKNHADAAVEVVTIKGSGAPTALVAEVMRWITALGYTWHLQVAEAVAVLSIVEKKSTSKKGEHRR